MTVLARVPFWAALPILAGGMVAGVYFADRTHDLVLFLAVVVVVALLAAAYLYDYSKLPMAPAPPPHVRAPVAPAAEPPSAGPSTGEPAPSSGTAGGAGAPAAPIDPVDLEPDYDPVEDADEIDRGERTSTG